MMVHREVREEDKCDLSKLYLFSDVALDMRSVRVRYRRPVNLTSVIGIYFVKSVKSDRENLRGDLQASGAYPSRTFRAS